MGDKLSALALVRVVDGRSQHIHDQPRAEADVESGSLLVFGRHDRFSASVFATANLLTFVVGGCSQISCSSAPN
jgi:hypothetical protein